MQFGVAHDAVDRSGICDRIAAARGWRCAGLAILAGALSALSLAPFHIAPILLVTLPLIQLLIRAEPGGRASSLATAKRAFATGWYFGFGFHLAGLYWIGGAFLVQADAYAWLMPFAVVLMPAGLALFFAIAAAACVLIPARWMHPAAVFVLCFSAAEALRSYILTGFPWNNLGYALAWPDVLMQSAALIGVHGLTLVTIALAVLPAPLWQAVRARAGSVPAMLAVALAVSVPLVAMIAYGTARLSNAVNSDVSGARVRIVQPSIPQADKWSATLQGDNFEQHLQLSTRSPDGQIDDLAGITHVIWPEAAMPFGPLNNPGALQRIADLLPEGTHLIAGILRAVPKAAPPGTNVMVAGRPPRDVFNSAAVFDSGGRAVSIYDKIHLVPFGEYLPFQEFLESLGLETVTRQRGGFTAAVPPRRLVQIAGLPPVELLICYEVIFPHEIGRAGTRPSLMINLTNDGWYGRTSGPFQHFHQSRVRAAEIGVPLLRAANNGVSAVVDGYGRVRERAELDAVQTIDSGVPTTIGETPYWRYGDMIFVLMWLALATVCLLARAIGRRKEGT